MTKDEAMKMAQDACPYTNEELRGAFYDGFIKALDQLPDTTEMIEQTSMSASELADRIKRGEKWKIAEPDMGIDRGAWDDQGQALVQMIRARGENNE